MASMLLILLTMVAAELKISQIYGRGKELQLGLQDSVRNLISTKIRILSKNFE